MLILILSSDLSGFLTSFESQAFFQSSQNGCSLPFSSSSSLCCSWQSKQQAPTTWWGWVRMPFKLPIKPFDSNCWCCHRQFAKLIDHLLFKLKFDVLEQAIQHQELMGWDEIQGARETCTWRKWIVVKKKKEEGNMLNRFHGSVSNKYCGCKIVHCGCWSGGLSV